METYLQRAHKVRENREFQHRISRLLAERYADQPAATYVEQRIYDGFPSNEDEARLATFHRLEWPHRMDPISSIEDERYRELGDRIVATEQSQLLTDVQRTRWDAWRRDRILATGENPWLTIPNAMAELDELAQAVEAGQEQQLSDIRNLLATFEARCTTHEVHGGTFPSREQGHQLRCGYSR